jgi:polysaccharide export outer membrane protein
MLALATAIAFTLACSGPGKYVWVDAYDEPPGQGEKPYVIASGDVILVRVFGQDQIATRARVRSDGKISLPLLDDVKAAGLTPIALSSELREQLKDFIKDPRVTVSLEETGPSPIYVIGEVAKPGVYPLDRAGGVLAALVNAGGLTQDACTDCIFVLRQGASAARIRFAYDALLRPAGRAPTFQLRPGDVIVVE